MIHHLPDLSLSGPVLGINYYNMEIEPIISQLWLSGHFLFVGETNISGCIKKLFYMGISLVPLFSLGLKVSVDYGWHFVLYSLYLK